MRNTKADVVRLLHRTKTRVRLGLSEVGLSGERNRLHLAWMLKSSGNVLRLDEPTNDLDVAPGEVHDADAVICG